MRSTVAELLKNVFKELKAIEAVTVSNYTQMADVGQPFKTSSHFLTLGCEGILRLERQDQHGCVRCSCLVRLSALTSCGSAWRGWQGTWQSKTSEVRGLARRDML